LAINPGLNAYDSTENQEIFVTRATPFLPVKTIQRVSEMRPIAYKVTEVKDPTQYVGKSTTKVMGVAGKESVVEEITYENGAVRSRKKLSSKVMQAPVTQIVLVGTKPAPVRVATGVFRRPTGDCVISSNYGYRRSEFHTGVDFALPSGSAVVAADGGTIAYAGWKGDYGNLVIISHGNGLQTYYGHNSRLTVTTGQQIAKGEQIAEIGSTGRSTGPHCHFEIRQDGRHVNPWRYIS
ncbi:MAG: peptidoglycan DD-metalloendopeptidase family protein, partial [Clostridia bacterium]